MKRKMYVVTSCDLDIISTFQMIFQYFVLVKYEKLIIYSLSVKY